jgi:hypothetical protein
MFLFFFINPDALGGTPKWIKKKRAKEEAERLAREKAHLEWYNSPEAVEERRLHEEQCAYWAEAHKRWKAEEDDFVARTGYLKTYPS